MLVLLLAGCGQLGAFSDHRPADDTAAVDTDTDEPDTDLDTDTDTDTDVDTDTDTDTQPPTYDGTYTGAFTMDVYFAGTSIPVDGCTGSASVWVTTSASDPITGNFTCTFGGLLGAIGPQQGSLTGDIVADPQVDAYATMGLFFVFDELAGAFQAPGRLVISESGTETVSDLGDFDYAATIDVTR